MPKRRRSPQPPVQPRAQATYDAILRGAEKLILAHGHARFTMRALERASGVAVGSIYQYFPDKADIVGTLLERQLAENLAAIDALIAAGARRPLREFLSGLIEGTLALYAERTGLRRVFMESSHALGRYDFVRTLLDGVQARLLAAAGARAPRVPEADRARHAFLVVSAVNGVVRSLLLAAPAPPAGVASAQCARDLAALLGDFLAKEGWTEGSGA